MPLQKIIWDGNLDAENWREEDFHEAYVNLKNLAIEGKTAVIIDGLDEIGLTNSRTSQAFIHPSSEVDLKTACVGILTQKI